MKKIFSLLVIAVFFAVEALAQTATVEFRVNMSVQIKKGKFTIGQEVSVRGNFNDWTATPMTDPDNDSIYSATVTGLTPGQELQFKFVKGADGWEGDPNRTFTPQAGNNVYYGWFDRDSVYSPTKDIFVTFVCNMELERLSGRFNPTTDTVSVNGSFNGWASKRDIMTPSSDNPDNYEVTVIINAGVGEKIKFKFWYTPNNWESIPDREYIFTQTDYDNGYTEIVGNYNNGTLSTVLNQPAVIKFTVNTNGARSVNGNLFANVQTVHVAGSASPLQWPGQWANNEINKLIQLYDDGTNGDVTAGDKIFSRNITFPAFTVLRVEYKYSINYGIDGQNDGTNDNEAGFAQNHILNMGRFWTGATVVDTFGVMGDSKVKDVTTGVISEDALVKTFALEQNYPNPFNPTTIIRFSLPEASYVIMKVFNLLGQEVATLVSENLNAGIYSVNFDASNLTSGIYIYKISAGKYEASKKMLLIK